MSDVQGAPAVICATAEIALNRVLRLEASVIDDCAHLRGRSLEFVLDDARLAMTVEFIDSGVRVLPQPERAPDVQVRGRVQNVMASLGHVLREQPGLPAGLAVQGDAELLDRFRAMLQRVGFDAEEWLAPLLGGAAAHRVVGGLKSLFGWTASSARRVADNTAEYLREETYDLARGRDVARWMDEVDATRERADRLDARLRDLEARRELA